MREELNTLNTPRHQPEESRATPFSAVLLQALSLTVLALTVAGALMALWRRADMGEPIDGGFVILLVSGFILGLTMGGLLWGMAGLLDTMSRRQRSPVGPGGLHRAPNDASDLALGSARHANSLTGTGRADYALGLVSESFQTATHLDLSLIEPTQREEVHERMMALVQRRAAEVVIDAINRRQLGEARQWLREAEALFGSTPATQRLDAKIAESTERNEPLDFASAKHTVRQATLTLQWAMAEDAVRSLCLNHPESNRCRRLWDDTRRAGLHAYIERCAHDHRWLEAFAAASEFIERFPDCREAETLGTQLPTLEANAEIMQRKQYESRFKELVGNHEYEDAVRLAKLLIDKYPDSPQATALRVQLPELQRRLAV